MHVLGKCEIYGISDAGLHHRLGPTWVRALTWTADYLSLEWLNDSAGVNNSIKNETFEQRNEFNMCFVLLNLCPAVILTIINEKNRCL